MTDKPSLWLPSSLKHVRMELFDMRFAFTFVTFHIIVNTGIAWELAEIML